MNIRWKIRKFLRWWYCRGNPLRAEQEEYRCMYIFNTSGLSSSRTFTFPYLELEPDGPCVFSIPEIERKLLQQDEDDD